MLMQDSSSINLDLPKIRLIIAGSRDFNNYFLMCDIMHGLTIFPDQVVSGMAKGADTLGIRWAKENNVPVKEFPADWSLGKKGGYLRNVEMSKYSNYCLLFWNGSSLGTRHMEDIARKEGLKVRVIKY